MTSKSRAPKLGLRGLAVMTAALIACASTSGAGDGAKDGMRGRVVGPDGRPLDGVRITTEPPTDAVLTFEGGYEITRIVKSKSPLEPGIYTLIPYKLGWWVGKNAPKIVVKYPGGDFTVPDIRLQPIGGPTLDGVAAPDRRNIEDDARGSGVIRDGE